MVERSILCNLESRRMRMSTQQPANRTAVGTQTWKELTVKSLSFKTCHICSRLLPSEKAADKN